MRPIEGTKYIISIIRAHQVRLALRAKHCNTSDHYYHFITENGGAYLVPKKEASKSIRYWI